MIGTIFQLLFAFLVVGSFQFATLLLPDGNVLDDLADGNEISAIGAWVGLPALVVFTLTAGLLFILGKGNPETIREDMSRVWATWKRSAGLSK